MHAVQRSIGVNCGAGRRGRLTEKVPAEGAIGAITGNSSSAARGAGVGAVSGGAKGASQGEQDEVRVVKNCLRGRGYRVLN